MASESGSESDDGSLGCSFGNDEAEGFDINFSDSEDEREPEPLPVLEILNRFCIKVKEEAMISDKAVERIRTVTISLLKTASQQSKAQVTKILEDNGIDTTCQSYRMHFCQLLGSMDPVNLMILVTIQATSLILPRGKFCFDSRGNGKD